MTRQDIVTVEDVARILGISKIQYSANHGEKKPAAL